jgi:hypothetical protein
LLPFWVAALAVLLAIAFTPISLGQLNETLCVGTRLYGRLDIVFRRYGGFGSPKQSRFN